MPVADAFLRMLQHYEDIGYLRPGTAAQWKADGTGGEQDQKQPKNTE